MFKKATAVAMTAVLALAMFTVGCGAGEESSMTMDISNDKAATIELSNAKEDDLVLTVGAGTVTNIGPMLTK